MPVKGKVREDRKFEKYIGLFEAEVVAINPSKEELAKLLGLSDIKDEIEYLKTDEQGEKMRLTFWLKNVDGEELFPLSINLRDEVRQNKDKTKFQYVNNIGSTAWADAPENLPEWFLEGGRDYRKAKSGEEELYSFLRSWLYKLELNDAESTLDIDFRKLMKGNVRELIDLRSTPYARTLVALATIRTAENKQGEITDYQQIYNRDFLPGYTMKFFRLEGSKKPKNVEKFIDRVTDPEYGCKDFYGLELGPLKVYDPTQNIATSSETEFSETGPDL